MTVRKNEIIYIANSQYTCSKKHLALNHIMSLSYIMSCDYINCSICKYNKSYCIIYSLFDNENNLIKLKDECKKK